MAADVVAPALAGQDDEEMVHVTGVAFAGNGERAARQPATVLTRKRPASLRPGGEKGEPGAKNRRLHFVQSRIDTRLGVLVTTDLTAVPQPANPVGQGGIVGRDRAPVTERAEVLRRVEAEGAGDADRANGSAGGLTQDCLAAILDDCETMTAREGRQGGHVRGLTVQM